MLEQEMWQEKEVLSIEEAAELLDVEPQTVKELAAEGRLPARKVGRGWRFSRAALKEVLSAEEAAEFLGVRAWTVRELAAAGRLPGRKVGKVWRFSRHALLEWLRGSQVQ